MQHQDEHTNKAPESGASTEPGSPTEQPSTQQQRTAPTGGNGYAKYIIGAVIVAALVALGVYFYGTGSGSSELPVGGSSVTEDGGSGPVARVNGEEISRADYQTQISQLQTNATQQGMDPEEASVQAQIQQRAVDTLVNTELLIQASQNADLAVSAEEVESEFQAIAEQAGGTDALQTRIEEVGLTEAEVRQNIEDELLIDAYLSANTSDDALTVSDEEVQAFYDQISQGQEGVPPLADIRGQIETQVAQTKQQELIAGIIEELKANADIEILI